LIQPAGCKAFGPALNGEVRKPPAAHTRSKWDGEGAAFGPPFLCGTTCKLLAAAFNIGTLDPSAMSLENRGDRGDGGQGG
jgi:hypothetical protein